MEKEFLKQNWIFIVISGFLFGTAFASIGFNQVSVGIILLFISIIFGFYAKVLLQNHALRDFFVLISLFFLFSSFGVFRFINAEIKTDQYFESAVSTKINILGTVVQEPKDRDTYRQYVLKTDNGVGFLIKANPFPQFQFGDRLSVYGKIEKPKSFVTDQGTVFNYPAYLSKEGISYTVSFASLEKVGEINAPIRKTLFHIKQSFITSLERLIPFPESALLGGILLGVDDSMGKDLLNAFRIVGIIHIVVLSGYNITLVAESVRKSLSFLSLRRALFGSSIGIILFVVMIGFSPSVVRAALMAILALIARATHRTYEISRALAVSAFFMVVWNPKVLIFDLGFQLSFLATVALIWISPVVASKLKFFPEKFGFRDIASTTIATQLFVLPLLVYSSGMISFSSFIVNLLVLPIVPMIMFFGFVTGLLGLMSFYLGFIPGFITNVLLSYVIWIAEYFSKIPGSIISVTDVSVLLPILFYLTFGGLAFYLKTKKRAL